MAKSRKAAQVDFTTAFMERRLGETGAKDPLAHLGTSVVVGIPLEAFSLQFLFGLDVCPIGKFYELAGIPETCKSFFTHEIGRWHVYGRTNVVPFDPNIHTGRYVYNLAEPNRDQNDLRKSVIQHTVDSNRVIVLDDLETVEDWQRSCTWACRTVRETKNANGATVELGDVDYMVCMAVDSLSGLTTRKEFDEIVADGAANPNYAHAAKSINLYFKALPPLMRGLPISFVCTNHLKVNRTPNGAIDERIPGGYAPYFADSIRFQMKRVRDKTGGYVDLNRATGRDLWIETMKNSMTSSGGQRQLRIQAHWVIDDNGRQKSVWQWHDATINLLTVGLDERTKKLIDDVVDLDINKTTRTVSSDRLKLKKVTWDEGGQAIMADPEVLAALQKIFMVRRQVAWQPGRSYREQLEEARRLAYEQEEREQAERYDAGVTE